MSGWVGGGCAGHNAHRSWQVERGGMSLTPSKGNCDRTSYKRRREPGSRQAAACWQRTCRLGCVPTLPGCMDGAVCGAQAAAGVGASAPPRSSQVSTTKPSLTSTCSSGRVNIAGAKVLPACRRLRDTRTLEGGREEVRAAQTACSPRTAGGTFGAFGARLCHHIHLKEPGVVAASSNKRSTSDGETCGLCMCGSPHADINGGCRHGQQQLGEF